MPLSSKDLNDILNRYGGWDIVFSRRFEPSKELLDALEDAGLDRRSFEHLRVTNTMNPREEALRELAELVCHIWRVYLAEADPPCSRDKEAPDLIRKWTDLPKQNGLWTHRETQLLEHGLTKDDVEYELRSHPHYYRLDKASEKRE